MFKGSIVALVTPFKNGQLDENKIKDLVEHQIQNGTQGIVPCGTTGESPTLSTAEHERVVELCVQAADKRVPVIAGTGSNSTSETGALTKHAAKAGADGALIVSPYYNKPTQRGLYLHYKEIADNVDIPIILYNIAGRTAVNIEVETIAKLAQECKNIIGVKEASGSLAQMTQIKNACPDNFLLISGDDNLILPILSIGGVGVISVLANIVPQDVTALIKSFEDGDLKGAQALHYKMVPLAKAMFLETNPIPIKAALGLLGLCSDEVRLPLCSLSDENLAKLKKRHA